MNTFYSKGEVKLMVEILLKGLLDTVFGMGVVFVLLIFLAVLIWAFKFIPMIEKIVNKKKQILNDPNRQAVDNVLSQIEAKEEDNLINDSELVAVITAAIMASMGDSAPSDGLIVRSIKKANKNTWIHA